MATFEKPKKRNQVRVYISPSDKEFWDENIDKSTLKNWINLGKKYDIAVSEIKKDFSSHIEELNEKIEKLSDNQEALLIILASISRLLNLTSAQNQVELEELKYKEKNGIELTTKEKNILRLSQIKDHNFNNLLEKLLLRIDSESLLSLKER